jgi:hypothetical protein
MTQFCSLSQADLNLIGSLRHEKTEKYRLLGKKVRRGEIFPPELEPIEAKASYGTQDFTLGVSFLNFLNKKLVFTSFLQDENNTTPVCMGGIFYPLFLE